MKCPPEVGLDYSVSFSGDIFMVSSLSSLTESDQTRLVALFEQGCGAAAAASCLGLSFKPCDRFYNRWRIHGRLVLVNKSHKRVFTFEVKRDAVQRFLAGETRMCITQDLGLASVNVVTSWVRIYRDQGEDGLRPKPKGRRPKTGPRVLSQTEELEQRIRDLEAENAYLKALRDLMNNEQ